MRPQHRRTIAALVLAAMALAAVAGAVSAVRAAPVVMTRTYAGASDTPSRTLFYVSCNQAPYLGGVCFEIPPGATTVEFTIDDATTTHPGAHLRMLPSGGGAALATYEQCAPEPFAIPPGTNRVQVFVNGLGNFQTCPELATGTAGTVTARFEVQLDPPDPDENGYVPSQPVYDVLAERDRYVPSGDSTIEVDVYRPDAPGAFPVIVWFDVYWKDDPGAVVNSERDYFVSRGYVFVHASSPGSNTSGGSYDNAFGPAEQQAAYDVVEWAGVQPWSDGKVGMQGLSYAAIIEYFVAAMRPPHLVTIYPTSAYSDLYREIVYAGGNLQAGYPIVWDVNNRSTTFLPPTTTSDEPATKFGNYATSVSGYRPILLDFLAHPNADDFYAERSPVTGNRLIEVPAAIDVGWGDDMVYGGPINFETLGSDDKRLIIGPWGHSGAHRRPDGRPERLRWFDHHLKGLPSGVDDDPRARVFVEGSGWIDANGWPLPGTTHVPLYLSAAGLTSSEPTEQGSGVYTYSPLLDDDGDTLTFTTEPLAAPVTVVGYPELIVHAATSARDTSWNVAVYDVAPGGARERLQRGWLRARAREIDPAMSEPGRPWHTFDGDEDVPAGEVVEYRIAIWPFARTFAAGHRIEIVLNDEAVGPGGAPALMPLEPATNEVHFGPQAPSRLLLPVL